MKKIVAILIILSSLNIAFAQSVNTVYLRQIKPEQLTQPTIEVMLFLMDLSLGGKSINEVGALCFLDGTCRSSWTGSGSGGSGNITVNTFTGNITIQGSAMINVTNSTTADGGKILLTFNNQSLENLDARQALDNTSIMSALATKEAILSFNFPLTRLSNAVSFDNTSLANLDAREYNNNLTQDQIKANVTDLTNTQNNLSQLANNLTGVKPYNQSLNTSDAVLFASVNVTGNMTIRESNPTQDTYLTILANGLPRDANIRLSSGDDWEIHTGNKPDDTILPRGFVIWNLIRNNYPFTINSFGKIGINTTSQTALLSINSSDTVNPIRVSTSSASNRFVVNGTTGFTGLGTSDAVTTLDVRGNSNISGYLNLTNLTIYGWSDYIAQAVNPPSPSAGTARVHSATTQGFTRLEQDNEGTTNLILGRDSVFIAKNTQGSQINKGQPVYVTGSTGNVPNVAIAQSNSMTTLPAIGIALNDIGNGNFGQIISVGIITQIDTSAYPVGTQLWVSSSVAGGFTDVRPQYPNYVQRVGSVLVSGIGNGAILVTIAPFIGGLESGTTNNNFTINGTLNVSSSGNFTSLHTKSLIVNGGGMEDGYIANLYGKVNVSELNATNLFIRQSVYFTEYFGGQHFFQFLNTAPVETNGGQMTFLGQTGGADVGSTGAGNGGSFTFTGGTGGSTILSGVLAGVGGEFIFNGGTGGASADGTIIAGQGGTLTFNGGTGGANTGGGNGGNGGNLIFNGGQSGAGGNRAGGSLFFVGGVPTGTGSAGNIILARTALGANRGKVLIATSQVNGDVLRVNGNVTIDGNLSLAQRGSRLGVGSPIHVNFTINSRGNINATAYITNGTGDSFGGDFAEMHKKASFTENLTQGDIVGVTESGVTKTTSNAISYHVVSGSSAVFMVSDGTNIFENREVRENITTEILNETTGELQNITVEHGDTIAVLKSDFTNSSKALIAFAGKVAVKVTGTCNFGQYVIPSGNNDGTGICVNQTTPTSTLQSTTASLSYSSAQLQSLITQLSNYLRYDSQRVCQAWENKATLGTGKILCVVK